MPIRLSLVGVREAKNSCFTSGWTGYLQPDWQTLTGETAGNLYQAETLRRLLAGAENRSVDGRRYLNLVLTCATHFLARRDNSLHSFALHP